MIKHRPQVVLDKSHYVISPGACCQRATLSIFVVTAFSFTGCSLFGSSSEPPLDRFESRHSQNVIATSYGVASFYGPGFHGRKTANGEVFDQNALTAAHKKLPFGTVLNVTDIDSGRSVKVRINDRGPFIRGRDIDVSQGVAKRLGFIKKGVVNVKLEILTRPKIQVAKYQVAKHPVKAIF